MLPKASVIMNVGVSAHTRIPTITASQKMEQFCVLEVKIECYHIQIWDQILAPLVRRRGPKEVACSKNTKYLETAQWMVQVKLQ